MAASLSLKDLEALVKGMSPHTNLLVHNPIHKIFLDIYLSWIKDDCVYLIIVKSEIFNNFKYNLTGKQSDQCVHILAPKMTSLIKQIG